MKVPCIHKWSRFGWVIFEVSLFTFETSVVFGHGDYSVCACLNSGVIFLICWLMLVDDGGV